MLKKKRPTARSWQLAIAISVALTSGLAIFVVEYAEGSIYLLESLQKDNQKKDLPSKAEISNLVEQLGSKEFKVREEATKRLFEIGPPALQAIEKANVNEDLELRMRAAKLMTEIRAAHRLPTRVNGVDFQFDIETHRWTIKKGEQKAQVGTMLLGITNVSHATCRFRFGDISMVLRDSKGTEFKEAFLGQKRSGVRSREFSEPIEKNGYVSYPCCKADLRRMSATEMSLTFTDETAKSFGFLNLAKGDYTLAIRYRNQNPKTDDGSLLWVGSIETLPQPITLSWED